MKILLVNKFLYPKGGVETYIIKLGQILQDYGHEVQYFGLANEKNIMGNTANSYVSNIDFSDGICKNLMAPLRIIYSTEARRKLRKVLEDFQPDIVHLNNIQFHLTPSIILEIEKYKKNVGRKTKIIYTAHDYQLICPSHGLFDNKNQICEKCIKGNYLHCLQSKCIKNSRLKSFLGVIDAYFWKINKAYSYIDKIICCSEFMKTKLDIQERYRDKTIVIHNFADKIEQMEIKKEDYIIEFGHLSREKGTLTLLEAAKRMSDVKFVFAGFGDATEEIAKIPNAEYVGFQTGKDLELLIRKAKVSVCPSECYENCPFSVIESQEYGTPVVASRIGGIPELIEEGKTGLLFRAGDSYELEKQLKYLMESDQLLEEYTNNCKEKQFETYDSYYQKLIKIYGANDDNI